MKRLLTMSAVLAMTISLCACGSKSSSSDSAKKEVTTVATETETTTAAEKLSAADQLLEDVKGTYDELFTVISDPKYDQIWLDNCEKFVGKDMAENTAEMLKNACMGTVYGEEAVKAYTNTENVQFDCFFINGVKQFVFNGSKISGLDDSGKKVFEYEYKFVKDFSLGGMMDGYLYEADDKDAGEFRYFLMMPDTPASTYHIEFRYGSDMDALAEYNKGAYAYWLAAGIPADCDEKLISDCIALFTEENLSEMTEQESGDKIEISR